MGVCTLGGRSESGEAGRSGWSWGQAKYVGRARLRRTSLPRQKRTRPAELASETAGVHDVLMQDRCTMTEADSALTRGVKKAALGDASWKTTLSVSLPCIPK